jgi:hypothetical protein
MGIQQSTQKNGNGIPDKYEPHQAEIFISADNNLKELENTVRYLLKGYSCDPGQLKSVYDYKDAIQWYKDEMKTQRLNHKNIIEILKIALRRAKIL